MDFKGLVEQAKRTDMVNLLSSLGYTVVPVGNFHTTKEHDSLRIFHRSTWTQYSTHAGGDVINWMRSTENMDFKEAVRYLLEFQGYRLSPEEERLLGSKDQYHNRNQSMYMQNQSPDTQKNGLRNTVSVTDNQKVKPSVEEKTLHLQPKAENQKRLYGYLHGARGISNETIRQFYATGNLYQSDKNNVVFVGRDKEGIARYGFQRGTSSFVKFRGDVPGSDKEHYGFTFCGSRDLAQAENVIVFEAAIDLMSYYDITRDTKSVLFALGGVGDGSLEHFLAEYPNIKKIKLVLDTDVAGQEATEKLLNKWATKGYAVSDGRYPFMEQVGCKDINDLLSKTDEQGQAFLTPDVFDAVTQFFLTGDLAELRPSHVNAEVVPNRSEMPAVSENEHTEQNFPQSQQQESMLIELMKSSLAEQNAMLMQLDQLSRSGEDVDLSEVDQIFGACNALYQLCAKAGLHPPLPGETWEAKERTVETLPSERMMKPPPAQSGVQKVTSQKPHRVRRM